jgi:hypothetical protein
MARTPVDWKYYVVDNAFVVRTDLRAMRAERLTRDGRWTDFPQLADITYNGRQLADAREAETEARELFAMYSELP